MKIIGITGPTGAGKTTALKALESLGVLVLDCDAVYHDLLDRDEALNARLSRRFPQAYENGRLNRKALGTLVWQDKAALKDLNDITHAAILDELKVRIARAEQAGYMGAAIDAVALLESGAAALCQETVAVIAPEEERISRIMAREGIDRSYAAARVAAQKPGVWFSARCGHTLNNDSTEEAFREKCLTLFSHILHTQEDNTMSDAKELRERLLADRKDGWEKLNENERKELEAYCEDYKRFLNAGRTERLCVEEAVKLAEANGFTAFVPGQSLKAGDKVYYNNRGKSIMLAVMGEEKLDKGAVIGAAHIDSPRLDLKPSPLDENSGLCTLKTHYYGGIRKYQWVSIPLELVGVVVKENGERVKVSVGKEPGDPVLTIPDLLPHLGDKQSHKPLFQGIEGEQLNLLAGSKPYPDDDGSDRVKLAVLSILNEKYGIVEEDLISAELMAIPAFEAKDVGLDRSMIGAYGQDDRVCGYAALRAVLEAKPRRTAVCMLADKEEIGSMGVTGMQSHAFDCFMEQLCDIQGVSLKDCFAHSFCLSADVTAAYDPNFAEVYEKNNAAYLNRGVGLCKYTGSRGKSGSSDATAELVAHVRAALNADGVQWQMAELGKVDEGGGGTVALYMANRNIDTLDAGTPVLAMHSPYEVTSKLDCYMTYRAMKAVFAR